MLKIARIAFACAMLPLLAAAGAAQAADLPFASLEELRKKYADPTGHITKVNGVEVYYKDVGKGPVLLMIHGSSSSTHTYDGIVAKLKDRYRIIRFDIPPLGLSGPVSDEDVKRLTPTDIPQTLLEQLGVKNIAACVGVSSGGTNCIYLAAKNPGLVDHLIVSNSPSDPVENAHPVQSKGMVKMAIESAANQGFKSREYWDHFFTFFAGEPDRITPAIRERYYDTNRRPPDKNLLYLSAKVADHEMAVDLMSKVKIPVLLVWGARDPLLTPPSADALAAYLKNAEVSKIMLPDVGHYPPLEVPDRFAQIIATYLEAATPIKPTSPDPKDR